MERETIVKGFVQLGKLMTALGNDSEWSGYLLGTTEQEYNQLKGVVAKQFYLNGWFTKENVLQSLKAIGQQLEEENLRNWVSQYNFQPKMKRIGLVMAGNIPLVGFHDLLCVILSGNIALCKLSSDDKTLLPALLHQLVQFCPEVKVQVEIAVGPLKNMDAVIATGSDNSAKYFEQYFGKYPHIFRKNRTSIAVLTGKESAEELTALGKDIFSYFGLGCRNVSHLVLPKDFELSRFFEAIVSYSEVVNHNKYGNNYDYNKAIYLMNQAQLFDNNFVLLRESTELFSPLAMIHYHYYESQSQVEEFIASHSEKLQVIVGQNYTPFGTAQTPTLSDYADGIDVMQWISDNI